MTAPAANSAAARGLASLAVHDARTLDAAVQEWVNDYNANLATIEDQVIPACWRQHPALTQELPVQFHGWQAAHRDPQATPFQALEYYTRFLPSFRDRITTLLAPDPLQCRTGQHPPADAGLAHTIERAATDVAARGPDIIDVLRQTTFGC